MKIRHPHPFRVATVIESRRDCALSAAKGTMPVRATTIAHERDLLLRRIEKSFARNFAVNVFVYVNLTLVELSVAENTNVINVHHCAPSRAPIAFAFAFSTGPNAKVVNLELEFAAGHTGHARVFIDHFKGLQSAGAAHRTSCHLRQDTCNTFS